MSTSTRHAFDPSAPACQHRSAYRPAAHGYRPHSTLAHSRRHIAVHHESQRFWIVMVSAAAVACVMMLMALLNLLRQAQAQ